MLEGDAVVLDLPPVDSYPPANVNWLDSSGRVLARTSDSHHITASNELVLLNTRYDVHNNAVFHATATNGYTLQTITSPLYVLRVQREYIHSIVIITFTPALHALISHTCLSPSLDIRYLSSCVSI